MRPMAVVATVVLAAAMAGCSLIPRPLEERSRVFDPDAARLDLDPGATPDEIAQRFAPTAALNLSIDSLAREGFVLDKVEELPGGMGQSVLRFRRPIPGWGRPTPAPMEFTGLYQVQDGAESPTYFIFMPHPRGYEIHILGPEGSLAALAVWDGGLLKWQDGDLLNSFALFPDGRGVTLSIDTVAVGDVDRVHRDVRALRITGD